MTVVLMNYSIWFCYDTPNDLILSIEEKPTQLASFQTDCFGWTVSNKDMLQCIAMCENCQCIKKIEIPKSLSCEHPKIPPLHHF